jgi:hypothetical protein
MFLGLTLIAMAIGGGSVVRADDLLTTLTSAGTTTSGQDKLALPEPTIPDGLSGAEQRKRLETVSAGKQSWDTLTRKAVVAPLVLKVGPKTGNVRTVDLWFVAYGELETVDNEDFLNSQVKSASEDDAENAPVVKTLTAADLAKRRISDAGSDGDVRYVAADITLLDRVRISAVTRSEKMRTEESVTVVSVLDPRFERDGEYPNSWKSIGRDANGKRSVGEAQTYEGLISYVKATKLKDLPGALAIEYHGSFVEPEGWFNGANLLASKLPIVAQDGVRKFRRSLEKDGISK